MIKGFKDKFSVLKRQISEIKEKKQRELLQNELEELKEYLDIYEIAVDIDLSISSNLKYYSGIIFKGYVPITMRIREEFPGRYFFFTT